MIFFFFFSLPFLFKITVQKKVVESPGHLPGMVEGQAVKQEKLRIENVYQHEAEGTLWAEVHRH